MLTSNTNSQSDLTALLLLSVTGVMSAATCLYWVLLQIERNTAAQFIHHYTVDDDDANKNSLELEIEFDNPAAAAAGRNGITTDLDPSMENAYASIGGGGGGRDRSPRNKDDNDNKTDSTSTTTTTTTTTSHSSRLRLSVARRVVVGMLTAMLVLLNYLLLVVSKAPTLLSATGLTLVSVVALHSQILEEIRRSRWDRLSFVVTLLLLLAMSLNLAAYAHKQVAVEDMYQGPARIVGYDTGKYEQLQGGVETTSTKTDLQVAWGAAWACPLQPNKECRAAVNGALCERDGSSTVGGDDDDDNDGVQDHEEQESQEVYYDASGEKISDLSDHTVVYDKDGNVVENYNIDQTTTTEAQNGQVKAYDEDSSDVVYGSNGSIQESQAYTQTATYNSETGKIQDGTYSYQDATYNGNGTLQESYGEEETTSEDDNGGQEDIAEEYDVTYKDNGQVDSEEVVVDETEMDANGQDMSEEYEEYYVKENADGTEYDEAYVAGEDVEYDENGNIKNDTYEAEEATRNSDGTIDEEDVDETISVNQDGTESYNVAEEDIVYDENGNVIQDSKDEWDSGGNRLLRRHLDGDADSSSLEQELQDEENENEELKEENEELEKENEELQEELDELEEEEEDIVEEEESDTESSSTDDDWYGDSYWGETDWSSVWGDYQCYDMFDADLEGISYDATTPPGEDDWPYLNIYGNCRTCEAYIVDYYSTEHFLSIRSYKLASRNYGIAASFSLMVTVALALKQRFAPKGDNEVDLLASASSGAFA